MPTSQISGVLQHLRKAALLREGAGLTDGQLLGRFLERRDEAAFAALVGRHGPMVWGVCRRLLHNPQDAEDAFQATFLVLVRKAASVRRETVANWLYGVAHQTARKARATTAKRRSRERQVTDMPEPALEQRLWDDLQPVLDHELSRLPDKYRAVVVLCDLEGKTRKEVARQLGCPEGTVASRLATARATLAKRLARHGLAVSGGTLATLLSRNAASASAPAAAVSSTVEAAGLVVSGRLAAAGAVPARVVTLVNGVMKTMLLTKLKTAVALLAVIGLFGLGTTLLGPRRLAAEEPRATARKPPETPSAADPGQAARPGEERDLAFPIAPADQEARRLAGAWAVRHVETGGRPMLEGDELRGARIVFAGNKAEVKGLRLSCLRDFSFRLHPTKTPKEIDVTFLEGPSEDRTFAGIYVARGNELRICLRLEEPERGRPKGFATNGGTTLVTMILDRAEEAGPPPERRDAPAAPLRIANGLGFRPLEGAKAFREYWGSLADDEKLTGKLSDHLTRDRIASVVALEVNIAVAQFFNPVRTSLDDELQRFLARGGRFHTGRLPDGFENERPPKAVVLLVRTKDGKYGLLTFYSRFVVVEMNKRVGVVLDEAEGNDKSEKGRQDAATAWDPKLFAGAFMFDGPAAFGKYLRGADVVAIGKLARWDAQTGGAVRVEKTLRGKVEGVEVAFTPNGGLVAARPGDRVVVVLRGGKGRYTLHSFCGAPGLYEHSDALQQLVEGLAAQPGKTDSGKAAAERGSGPAAGRLDVQAYFSEEYGAISARAKRADGTTVLHGLQLLLGPKNWLKEYAVYNDGVLEQRYQYYPSGLEFRRQRREHNGEGYEVIFTPERTKVLAEHLIVSGGVDIGPLKVQDEIANGEVKGDRRWKGTFLEWEHIPHTYGQERLVLREYRDGKGVKATPYPAERLGLPPDPHGHKGSAAWPWRWPWRDFVPEWPAAR